MMITLNLSTFFSTTVKAAAALEIDKKEGRISVKNPMLQEALPEKGVLKIKRKNLGDIGEDLLLFSKAIQSRIFEDTPSTTALSSSFALGVAQGFCRLVLDNNNFSYTILPLANIDPVLEHPVYNTGSPDYDPAMHGRLTGYLLYINFAYNIMYSGQMTSFSEGLFNTIHHTLHRTPGIPSREETLWGRRALRLAAIGLGGVNSFIELSLFFGNGLKYGTLARNAITIPFALISILYENFTKLDVHIDNALLYLSPGRTPEIAKKRNALVELLYRTEWTIATHLTNEEISDLFNVTSGTAKIKFSEEAKDIEIGSAAAAAAAGSAKIKYATHKIEKEDEDIEGLESLARIRHLVQHGTAFPDLKNPKEYEDNTATSNHQFWRNGLRWTGRVLGTTAAWGLSIASKNVIEGAMISGGIDPATAEATGYALGITMGLARDAGASQGLGDFLVSLYDSATGFAEPSTRVQRVHADPYDGKYACYNITKRMWSFLHGGLYPLILLSAALPEMGYNWDLVITEKSFRVDYAPDNVPFVQALWPLIPMVVAAAIPETNYLDLSLGKTINTLSEFYYRARGAPQASTHRARLITQIQRLTQSIIHAPDSVIDQAYILLTSKEAVSSDFRNSLSRRILKVASGKSPTAASGKITTSPVFSKVSVKLSTDWA